MKRLTTLLTGLLLGLMLAVPALSADYDLVILNGRVMDPELVGSSWMPLRRDRPRSGVVKLTALLGSAVIALVAI